MLKVEIQGDDTFQIDASIVVRDLGLEPFEVQRLMHEGKLTSRCERGVDEDVGRYRLTFFHKNRRLRLITMLKCWRFANGSWWHCRLPGTVLPRKVRI